MEFKTDNRGFISLPPDAVITINGPWPEKGMTDLSPAIRQAKARVEYLKRWQKQAKARGSIGEPYKYNLAQRQRIDKIRSDFAGDLMQPWYVKKGEVHKGWQPNPDYIKVNRNNPTALKMFTLDELRKSGLVSRRVAELAASL